MNTEITKIARTVDLNGWVLYDARCPFCSAWAERFEKILTRRGFDLAPLQSPWVAECLDVGVLEPAKMIVISSDGAVFSGVDGILFLARSIWWAWPLFFMGLVPVVRRWMRKGYAWLAAHRMRFTRHQCLIHLRRVVR